MQDDIKDFIIIAESYKTKDNKGFNSIKKEMLGATKNLSDRELKNVLDSVTFELLDRQNNTSRGDF